MMIKFGVLQVQSQLLPSEKTFNQVMSDYHTALEQIGAVQLAPDEPQIDFQTVYLVATGGCEEHILKLVAQTRQRGLSTPVFLIAHPGFNALPAALEVLARLQQDGLSGQVFYLASPRDENSLHQLQQAVEDQAIHSALSRTRIGLIGPPSDWLVASKQSGEDLQQLWGPEVIPIEMGALLEVLDDIQPDELTEYVKDLRDNAISIKEPTPVDLEAVVRVYVALERIIEQYGLTALTLRCFDLVLGLKTTGCFALSQLTDNGLIAGCEGDLPSTLGMIWARAVTQRVPWMANPAQIDTERNELWLAHCTVPRSMVHDYELRSHFESGLGVGIQGRMLEGPVTLLRIGGKHLEQLWLGEGSIFQTGKSEDLCRTQVKIHLTEGHVNDLLTRPLGNHLVLVPGHHHARMQAWWETFVAFA